MAAIDKKIIVKKKKPFNINLAIKIVLLLAIGALMAFRYRKIFIWTVISCTAGYMKYYRIKFYGHLPVVAEPTIFTATLLTRGYGLQWGLAFLFGPNVISELMTGGIQFGMIQSLLKYSVYMLMVSLLGNVNIVLIGILLCVLDVILDFIINTYIFPAPFFALIYSFTQLILHTVYFSIFGGLILGLLTATK